MKSPVKFSKADGSTRRKIFEIANQCGRYSRKMLAKRRARFERVNFNLNLLTKQQ